MDAATASALVTESAKRAGLIWVRRAGDAEPSRPLWHAWIDGQAYVLTGGLEQPMPAGLTDPGARAEVTVASKDKRSRLIVWTADVAVVQPNGPEWRAALPTLQAKRLNAPDGELAAARWARECTLLRLTPSGEIVEDPDERSITSHATVPPSTSAGTEVPRPWHLFGRRRRTAGS